MNTPPHKSPEQLAREHRLAAKLRENLKRRKVQARARADDAADETTAATPQRLNGPPDSDS